jgi:hypothetical protein
VIDQARQRGAELAGLQRLLRGTREPLLPLDRQGLALVRGEGVGAVGRLAALRLRLAASARSLTVRAVLGPRAPSPIVRVVAALAARLLLAWGAGWSPLPPPSSSLS